MYNIQFYIVTVWLVTLSLSLFVCVCCPTSRLTESPIPTLFIHVPTRFVRQLFTSAVVNCPTYEDN